MTKKQIEKQIKKEERYLNFLNEQILNIKASIRGTRKAIRMWKKEMKGAK